MSTLTEEQIRAGGTERLRRAMALIERAQNDLASACSELSALEHCSPIWKKCHSLTDHVHAFWYRVQRQLNSGKFRLDSTNIEGLARRLDESAAKDQQS